MGSFMNSRQQLIDLFNVVIQDKELMRLLYYKPKNYFDNPLAEDKPDVQTLDDFKEIVGKLVKRTPKTDDIETDPICRICLYLGNRSISFNKRVPQQDLVVDVYTHINDYDEIDTRSLWLTDRVHKLFSDKHVTGVSKNFEPRKILLNAPNGYIGYRMVFKFGSVN